MKTKTTAIAGATLTLLTTLTLVGCSAPDDAESSTTVTESAATPSAAAEVTPEPTVEEPTGTKAAPLPFGTVTNIADDSIWDFTVHDTQLDANARVAQADEFNESPAAGNQWVSGFLSVQVRDIPETAAITEAVSPSVSLGPVFVGSSGTVYDFWTAGGYPAAFAGQSWNALPDIFVTPGSSWDQEFGIEVPASEVAGGQFAVKHGTTGKFVFFG